MTDTQSRKCQFWTILNIFSVFSIFKSPNGKFLGYKLYVMLILKRLTYSAFKNTPKCSKNSCISAINIKDTCFNMYISKLANHRLMQNISLSVFNQNINVIEKFCGIVAVQFFSKFPPNAPKLHSFRTLLYDENTGLM